MVSVGPAIAVATSRRAAAGREPLPQGCRTAWACAPAAAGRAGSAQQGLERGVRAGADRGERQGARDRASRRRRRLARRRRTRSRWAQRGVQRCCLATGVNALISAGNWVGSTPEVWASSRLMVAGSSGRSRSVSRTGVTTFAVVDVAVASAATKWSGWWWGRRR